MIRCGVSRHSRLVAATGTHGWFGRPNTTTKVTGCAHEVQNSATRAQLRALSAPRVCIQAGIPARYASGMTVQITVRIADDAAAFLDQEATAADISRAAVITRALRREARRRRAEADAAIYAAEGENTELTGWQQASGDAVAAPWSELD